MYKLLKPLPGVQVGTEDKFEQYEPEKYPEWFEPINQWPKRFEDLGDYSGHGFTLEGGTFEYTKGYPTPAHAKSANAFRKLSALEKEMNGDWVADWGDNNPKYVIKFEWGELLVDYFYNVNFHHIAFKTREAAEFSLEHHRELWEDYFMLSK